MNCYNCQESDTGEQSAVRWLPSCIALSNRPQLTKLCRSYAGEEV